MVYPIPPSMMNQLPSSRRNVFERSSKQSVARPPRVLRVARRVGRADLQLEYPPGQALILAVGYLYAGKPILGSVAELRSLCCMFVLDASSVDITTMGDRRHHSHRRHVGDALLGTPLLGGMMAASGGALLFGAVRRLLLAPRIITSGPMAIGILTLANTHRTRAFSLASPLALCYWAGWCSGATKPRLR